MGGKYEIRWKINRKCPFWNSEFTDDLNVAFAIYGKAVSDGFTCVDLVMHDWMDCPADCEHREHLCVGGDAS